MSYNFFLGPYNQVILVVKLNAALQTPAYYRHLIITDVLLCPWGKKALKFSLNSIRFIRTPCYSRTPLYEHPLNKDTSLSRTVCFVPGEESPYIFSSFNSHNTDTILILTLSMAPLVSIGFDQKHITLNGVVCFWFDMHHM